MRARTAIVTLFFSVVLSACAPVGVFGDQPGRAYDYPPPPRIGTDEQQRRLADLARTAASEVDQLRRATMLVELKAHMWSMLPERYVDDNYDELASFVAETAMLSIVERRNGADADRPEVEVLSKYTPREMVALRITEAKHWTMPAARLMGTASAAADALESAGVLERNGQGAGRYEHATVFFNEENLRRLDQEDVFDPFIKALYANNRMAAARLCLVAAQARGQRLPPEDRVAEQRRVSAVLHEIREIEGLVLRREDLRYLRASVSGGPVKPDAENAAIAALDEPIREGLLHLARHPDWAVHLYIWRAFAAVPGWQTPELLAAVRSHQNPISLRFFRYLPRQESKRQGAQLDVE